MTGALTNARGPLGNRNYRLLLSGFALSQLVMPLQFLTQVLWVQEHAPQGIWLILVALIGACRGIGSLTFGLYGGALADRYDRRKLLMAIHAVLALVTIAIATLMHMQSDSVLAFTLFFLLTLLTAGLLAIDIPTRLAIVPDVLGPEHTPAGMSINQVVGQLAMPLAMFSTGFIIYAFDFAGAYLLSVVGHLLMILFLGLMHYTPPARTRDTGHYGWRETLADVRVGLSYARNQPVVLWVIILVITMMGMGFPATANLGPTWITTVVEVPIRDMGYVVMTWGVGSLIAALALTRYASVEGRGRLIGWGALLFAVSFVVFVSHDSKVNAIIGNLGLGAGMTMTMVSSTVLIQHLVAEEVRGRIMSIFQLNMGFAQLMTLPVALFAQWLTLPVAFPLLAVATTALVLFILFTQRQIMRA
ncbi:MAG: MFS transporter [Pseudomonadales bacterium]